MAHKDFIDLSLENAFFPQILSDLRQLVKVDGTPLKSVDPKYGQRLARLMSNRRYAYKFDSYIKWGGEALLLKLLETGGTGRTVAAKIANPELNADGRREVYHGRTPKEYEVLLLNDFNSRFKRGIRVQQDAEDGIVFKHGSIPKIIEVSEKPLYFIMQYVNGDDLGDWIIKADLPQRLDFFEELLEFMAELHLFGIVHRDLKPDNVMWRQGKPCLIDFTSVKNLNDEDHVTRKQVGFGCRMYAAPETLHDIRDCDWRSDIYSLGRMLEFFWTKNFPSTDGQALPQELYRIYKCATQFIRDNRYQFIKQGFLQDFQRAKKRFVVPRRTSPHIAELEKLLVNYPRIKKIAVPLYAAMAEIAKEEMS